MLFVGGGTVADSLAGALTALGVRLERVATFAARPPGAPAPALIVLAGDAAQGGGTGSLAQLQTGGAATPTLVIGAAEPAAGASRQLPSHVAHLSAQAVDDCARRVHALLDALRRGDAAGSGLQPLVDRLANQGRVLAAPAPGATQVAVPAIVLPPLKAANHNAGVRGLSEPGKAAPAPTSRQAAPLKGPTAPAVNLAPKLQTPPKAAKLPDAAGAQRPVLPDKRVAASGVHMTGVAAGAAPPAASPKVTVASKAAAEPVTKDVATMQVGGASEGRASAGSRGQSVPPPLPASKRAAPSAETPVAAPRAAESSAEHGNLVPAAASAEQAAAASVPAAVKSAAVPVAVSAPSAAGTMPSPVKSSAAVRTPAAALSVPSAAKSAAAPTAASTLASAGTPARAVKVPPVASSGNAAAPATAPEQPAAKAKVNQAAAAAPVNAPDVVQPKLGPQPIEPAGPFAVGRGKTAAGLGPAPASLTGPLGATPAVRAPSVSLKGQTPPAALPLRQGSAATPAVPAVVSVPLSAAAVQPVVAVPAPAEPPRAAEPAAADEVIPLSLPPSELRNSTRASEIEISIALSDAPPAPSDAAVRRDVAAAAAQTTADAERAQAERVTAPPSAEGKNARAAHTSSRRVGRSPLEPVAWSGMPLSAAMSDRAAKLVDPSGAAPTRRPRNPLEAPQAWPTDSSRAEAAVLTKRPRNPLEAPQVWSAPARSGAARDANAARPRRPRNPLEAPQGWPASARPREVTALEAESAAAPTVRPRNPREAPRAWPAEPHAGAGLSLEADANAASVPTVRPRAPALQPQAQLDAAHAFELQASSQARRVHRGWIVGAAVVALGCGVFLLLSRTHDRAQDPLHGNPAAGALVQTPALATPAQESPVQEVRPPAPLPPPGQSLSMHVAETSERTTPSGSRPATSAAVPRSSAREAAPTTPAGRAQALVDEGAAMLRQGRLGLAESKYMKALQESPEYPAALAELVRVHLARHDGREAVRWAERLVAVRNNGAHQLLLGDALLLRGNRGAAEEAWERAAEQGNATARKRLSAGK